MCILMHYSLLCIAASENVTVSAVSVSGSSPSARVTWSTTFPPECAASVRVEFRTNHFGAAVATNTTTNTTETALIQTGLRCATKYYITVIATGEGRMSDGGSIIVTLSSRQVQVFVGGKETV